jgi:hypothetical protein
VLTGGTTGNDGTDVTTGGGNSIPGCDGAGSGGAAGGLGGAALAGAGVAGAGVGDTSTTGTGSVIGRLGAMRVKSAASAAASSSSSCCSAGSTGTAAAWEALLGGLDVGGVNVERRGPAVANVGSNEAWTSTSSSSAMQKY